MPWPKGKKRTQEMNDKTSKAMKGRKLSEEHIRKLKIASIGKNKGKRNSPATEFKKGHKMNVGICHSPVTSFKKGHEVTKSMRQKMSVAKKGSLHPNWKGGISKEPYPFEWTRKLKESIRLRDNYRCQLCGIGQNEAGKKHHVHHVDYTKENLAPKNLITLCVSCHTKVNYNRKLWQEFFQSKLSLVGHKKHG
jgi:hypothetical protein